VECQAKNEKFLEKKKNNLEEDSEGRRLAGQVNGKALLISHIINLTGGTPALRIFFGYRRNLGGQKRPPSE